MPKRMTAMMLAILCLIGSFSTISARASDYIAKYECKIIDRGSGLLEVRVAVGGTHPRMTKIGCPAIALYVRNGNRYDAVESHSGLYDYNTGAYGFTFTYQGEIGREYMASATVMAQDSTGGDSRSLDSTKVIPK